MDIYAGINVAEWAEKLLNIAIEFVSSAGDEMEEAFERYVELRVKPLVWLNAHTTPHACRNEVYMPNLEMFTELIIKDDKELEECVGIAFVVTMAHELGHSIDWCNCYNRGNMHLMTKGSAYRILWSEESAWNWAEMLLRRAGFTEWEDFELCKRLWYGTYTQEFGPALANGTRHQDDHAFSYEFFYLATMYKNGEAIGRISPDMNPWHGIDFLEISAPPSLNRP